MERVPEQLPCPVLAYCVLVVGKALPGVPFGTILVVEDSRIGVPFDTVLVVEDRRVGTVFPLAQS